MQTELSEAYRKLAENIKEVNRLKHQINKDTDINGKPNTIDVSIDEGINIIYEFVLLMNLLILRNLLPWSFKTSNGKLLTLIKNINILKQTLSMNNKNRRKHIIVPK